MKIYRLGLIVVIGLVFIGLGMTAQSAPADELPPRPTVVPTATPTPQPTAVPVSSNQGGLIWLQVVGEVAAENGPLWTRVEWLAGDGNWQLVDGWQGHVAADGKVVWWVAPQDLGKGPFRWLVYQNETENEPLALSDSFMLPANSGNLRQVTVNLVP